MTNPGTWTRSHATRCSGLPSSAPDSWSDTCPPTPWAFLGPGLPSTSCFSGSDPGTSRHSGMLVACHPPPRGSCCAQAAGGGGQGGHPLGGSFGWVARPRQSPDSQAFLVPSAGLACPPGDLRGQTSERLEVHTLPFKVTLLVVTGVPRWLGGRRLCMEPAGGPHTPEAAGSPAFTHAPRGHHCLSHIFTSVVLHPPGSLSPWMRS